MEQYSPADYEVIVGTEKVTGYAEDTYIAVEKAEDTFTTVVGADGSVTRVKSLNKMHRVTMTLMGNSPTNDVLAALHKTDEENDGGAGIVPFLLRNKNGSTLIACDSGWVVKPANVSLGKSIGPKEWMFDLDAPSSFVGT